MKPKNITYLSDLHFDHNLWKSELAFWANEINYFEKLLEAIIKKLRDNHVISKAERFQNMFILHQNVIDEIKDKIDGDEDQIALIMKADPSKVNKKYFKEHESIRAEIDIQRKLFREMKEDFFIFMTQVN